MWMMREIQLLAVLKLIGKFKKHLPQVSNYIFPLPIWWLVFGFITEIFLIILSGYRIEIALSGHFSVFSWKALRAQKQRK